MSKKLPNLLEKTVLAFFLCFTQIANGYEVPYGYEGQALSDENFKLSAELLYLKPGIEQSSYVISSSENVVGGEFFPNGRRHNNSANYKPGFRINALYGLCDEPNALDVRFTYFNGGHSHSITGDFLFDTIGFPGDGAQAPEDTSYAGKASIHDNFRYYAVDATFNRLGLQSCVDNLYLLIGLHYANIQHKRHFTSVGTFSSDDGAVVQAVNDPVDNALKSHSNFWGVGPQLGLDYNYDLTSPECCLGLVTLHANMRASLLCSKSNGNFHYTTLRTTGTDGPHLKNRDLWRVNPAFDSKLGGSYQFCWLGLEGAIEVGYEWIWYNDSVGSIVGYDVAFAGDSLDVFSNLSLHGPYLKISVAF